MCLMLWKTYSLILIRSSKKCPFHSYPSQDLLTIMMATLPLNCSRLTSAPPENNQRVTVVRRRMISSRSPGTCYGIILMQWKIFPTLPRVTLPSIQNKELFSHHLAKEENSSLIMNQNSGVLSRKGIRADWNLFKLSD